MRPMRTVLVTTLVSLLLGSDADGQGAQGVATSPDGSTTTPAGQQRTGTGSIRGRVLSPETGAPIPRAQVLLTGAGLPPRTVRTDAVGRYEFTDLPASRLMISANKNGYIAAQYGQRRPSEAGKPLELAENQAVDNVDLLMPRSRAIVGRIVDDTGEPLTGATVTARRPQWNNGRRQWLMAGRPDHTNDLGEYRVYGLAAGAYQVTATLRNMDMGVFGSDSPPSAGAGRAASPTVGYAPTYYPGTASVADAHTVIVAASQDTTGVDFQLVSAPLARITGRVIGSDGRPLGAAIVSVSLARGSDSGALLGFDTTAPDGTFSLMHVPPGDYLLQVRPGNVRAPGGGDPSVPRVAPAADAEFAIVPLTVAGEDIAAGVITTSGGASLTGRVVFEGEPPANANSLRVVSIDDGAGTALARPSGTAPAPVRPDGTFEMKGLIGLRLFRVLGVPNGWTMKSIRVGGVEVIDSGIELKGTDVVRGLEIVLSPQRTAISGIVLSAAGTPVAETTVVLFSQDPTNWRVPSGRWVSSTRSAQDGRFEVRGHPSGSYYVVAVEYIPPGELTDPDLLARLAPKAQRLSLEAGQSQTVKLALTEGGW